jgi:transposase-like protein
LFFELYTTGLSTREIESITESIYGQRLTRSAVSRITALFSDEMRLFRERPIEAHYPILYLDATFIKTRRDTVASEAYYTVLGVKPDTTREILGIYNAPSESASVWEEIISDLKQRGLKQCQLVVSDDLRGLDSAIEQHLTVRIQKCVLHLKRNLLKKVRKTHRAQMAADLAQLFDLEKLDDTIEAAMQRAQQVYQRWYSLYRHITILNEPDQLAYYFTYLSFHPKIRNMIYTTNWIERLNKDFKRTIKFRNAMPSVESVLTLLCKVAIDKNESRYQYPIHRLALDSMFQ